MDWAKEWEITCTRVRIMMLKRGIESIPIIRERDRVDRWLAKMQTLRGRWKERKEKTTA